MDSGSFAMAGHSKDATTPAAHCTPGSGLSGLGVLLGDELQARGAGVVESRMDFPWVRFRRHRFSYAPVTDAA